jgi:hypothetical protein
MFNLMGHVHGGGGLGFVLFIFAVALVFAVVLGSRTQNQGS